MSCFGAKDKSRATEQGVRDEKLLTNGTSGPRPAPSALYAAVRAQIATGAEIPAWAVAKAVAALEAADRAPSWVLGVGEALAETFGPVANRFGLIDRVASLVALPAEATGESVRSAVSTWRALNSARASALQESWLVKDYRQLVAGAAAAAKEHARRHGSTTAPEDQTEEERFQEMTKGFKGRVVRIGERQRAA